VAIIKGIWLPDHQFPNVWNLDHLRHFMMKDKSPSREQN